jgi:CubicO group peptidase (beta-lactamase class C family)
MRRNVVFLLLTLFFFGGVANASKSVGPCCSGDQKPLSARKTFDLGNLKKIDALMKQAIAQEDLPSAVCYVSYHGKTIYEKAFGKADRDNGKKALKEDAVFRNASQTKLVTTVALMALYQEGRFNLEDPVSKYLPEFANPVVIVSGSMKANNLITRPAKGQITIRQLLCHSSGISYDSYNQDLQVVRYAEPITTAEAVSRIAKLPLRHDPGAGFTYGYSLDVAGRLAEVISGMRLDSLIRLKVLNPLHMKDTYFYLPKDQAKRLVPVYTKTQKEAPIMLADSLDCNYPLSPCQTYFGGGAGLCGTIEDYAHLCQMILNQGNYKGKSVLHKKVVEQMCTDQLFGVSGDYQFGLGLEIATPQTFARTMKSPGSLRWGGYYGTEYLIDPKYDIVILFYTNKVGWYNKRDVFGEMLRIVYTSLK